MMKKPIPPSDTLVLFGVTGDLAHKMIFPALYAMVKHGTLTVPVVGVASSQWTLARCSPARTRWWPRGPWWIRCSPGIHARCPTAKGVGDRRRPMR